MTCEPGEFVGFNHCERCNNAVRNATGKQMLAVMKERDDLKAELARTDADATKACTGLLDQLKGAERERDQAMEAVRVLGEEILAREAIRKEMNIVNLARLNKAQCATEANPIAAAAVKENQP